MGPSYNFHKFFFIILESFFKKVSVPGDSPFIPFLTVLQIICMNCLMRCSIFQISLIEIDDSYKSSEFVNSFWFFEINNCFNFFRRWFNSLLGIKLEINSQGKKFLPYIWHLDKLMVIPICLRCVKMVWRCLACYFSSTEAIKISSK